MSFKHTTASDSSSPHNTDAIPVIQTTESRPRDPRVHRPHHEIQTDDDPSHLDHSLIHDTVSGKLGALKRTAYHMLSKSSHSPHHTHRTTNTSKPSDEDVNSPYTQSAIDAVPYSPSAPTNLPRRFASMPQPFSTLPPSGTEYTGLVSHGLGSSSPPLVDFTRFEDTYRGPRNGTFEGLLSRKTPEWKGQRSSVIPKPGKDERSGTTRTASGKRKRRSSRGSHLRHGSTTSMKMRNTPSSISTGLSKNESHLTIAPQPAASRKPDPRSILAALRDVDEEVSFGLAPSKVTRPRTLDSYFSVRELLEMHYLDQVDFEEREMVRQRHALTGVLEVEGRQGDLVVMGESIRRASIYSSTTMILGGREHELPILVISCIEELYRTGIYQPNLFRALPNRARLMELIAIFDSETQPPGSIIRDRSRSRASRHIPSSNSVTGTPQTFQSSKYGSGDPTTGVHETALNSGFGAATSLHLESMPDICALLSTYISSLPEPILSPFLFRAIWDMCGIEEDEAIKPHTDTEPASHIHDPPPNVLNSPLQSTTSPMSPMLRTYTSTYTSPLASARILTAQLLLHLLPSPNFSLLVYFLAFFSQAALVREENGVGIEDLAKMFGGKIFGGGIIDSGNKAVAGALAPTSNEVDEVQSNTAHNARRPSDASSIKSMSASGAPRRPSITTGVTPNPGTLREGEVMMCWFLRRWGPISDGLFEVLSTLGVDEAEVPESDDSEQDVGFPPRLGLTEEKGSRTTSNEILARNASEYSRKSSSSSSCYSPSPSSPKTTPTLPKFLRRDTFGRIPLPQDWLDRISSASRPISRSLSLTRSRSQSLSRSLSLSRSRSKSASPPLVPVRVESNPTNKYEVMIEGDIVHARPDGRTRFQLGVDGDGAKQGRKRASSALPYASSPSTTSSRTIRDGWSRNMTTQYASKRGGEEEVRVENKQRASRSTEPSIVVPVAVPAEIAVPMSVQMLEEMDIVDDYVMLSLESASPSPTSGLGGLQAPIPIPPKVDTRLLDSYLRTELDISADSSPSTSPFSEMGPISPLSDPPSSAGVREGGSTQRPATVGSTSPLSIPVPPPPVNSLSTSPLRSPPSPVNEDSRMNPGVNQEQHPRKTSNPRPGSTTTSGTRPTIPRLPTVHLIPPSPTVVSPPPIPSPSTPPTSTQPPLASSPSSPTPTRLRATIHLVLLQNQLKRRTEALRRALTSSSKHFLRTSYLEDRVKQLEQWIEEHAKECASGGGSSTTPFERGDGPDILRVDAYGRPRERGEYQNYTRAVRPVDLKAMHHQRSKSAGYDGNAYGASRK